MHGHRHLILASQSPRRSELLAKAGFEFTISPVQISEIPDENLNLPDQIRALAEQKARACLNSGNIPKGQANLLLGADTVVVLDGQILGKPLDRIENQQYLSRLSGRTHEVITGVCLLDVDGATHELGHEISTIEFKVLNEREILDYCSAGEGLDKAGGYGIQGRAATFIAKVEGDYDNVVGLPIALFERMLKENGWNIRRSRR